MGRHGWYDTENGICSEKLFGWVNCFLKKNWARTAGSHGVCSPASVVEQKIHSELAVYISEEEAYNKLFNKEAYTLHLQSTYVCLDTVCPKSLWWLLFRSPKHYIQLGLLFCQLFQLSSGWPTNHHSCLWPPPSLQHHTAYLYTHKHIVFFMVLYRKSQTFSAASVLNIVYISLCLAKLHSWNTLLKYIFSHILKWVCLCVASMRN